MRYPGPHRLAVFFVISVLVLCSAPPSCSASVPVPTIYSIHIPLVLHHIALVNGDFESGRIAWQEKSSKGYKLIIDKTGLNSVLPHTGSWAAWLGGDLNETSTLSQTVTVNPGAPSLVYWYWILSEETNCTADAGRVFVNTDLLQQDPLCTLTNTGGWVRQALDLSAYAGSSVSIQFKASTNATGNSSLYIDDVSLQPK